MNQTVEALPFVARILRTYMRSRLRGGTRLTLMLADRLPSLQCVPIAFRDRSAVFVDMRQPGAHTWLEGTPWRTSPIEADEQALMSRIVRPGDIVFDIGANIGLHSVLLSRLVGPEGRVFVFEPNPQLTNCLARTVAEMGNGHLYPVALSDCDSDAVLYVPADHSMASLADWTRGRLEDAPVRLTCIQVQLDRVIGRGGIRAPDFIKCDVEGAELKVFRGGERTLSRVDAPMVLFEANADSARGFGLSMSAAADFLRSLESPRYRFFEVQSGGDLRPLDQRHRHLNVLAVPEARLPRVMNSH